METNKDVVVIGGGPGGYVAAIRAAQLGASTALIEKEELGGTCLNVGCIPTKAFAKIAELYGKMKKSSEMGINVEGISLDFHAVQAHKQKVVKTLKGGIAYLLEESNVQVIQGKADLTGPQKVTVTSKDGETQIINASHIIIATGAKPMELPGLEFDGDKILNSTDMLQLEEIPESLIVVGGGIIGIELACIYAQFGTKVTMVEIMPELLPFCDAKVTSLLKSELTAKGVSISVKTKVIKHERDEKTITATLQKGEKVWEVKAEKMLVAAGRKPFIGVGGIESLGIETNNGAIVVNEYLETNVSGIYAIGDVIGGYQLAHVASHEGTTAAENCMGHKKKMDYRVVPNCIYTVPEVGMVGINEKQAKEQYSEVQVGSFPFSACGKAVASGDTKGFVKIIADKESGKIVGTFIIGGTATDMIHEAALAMQKGVTIEEIIETIHAHPTLSESFHEAAMIAAKRPLHFM